VSRLPVLRAQELEAAAPEQHWLIEGLWAREAVGIVGGEPKCCKSFLALDVAVAVASGAACLRHFPVAQTGRVLLFAAEDAPAIVRRRLEGICRAAGVPFDGLDVHVITAPSLRLDLPPDQLRLRDTVAALRPRILILDPFVRLHRIDENAAAEVAPMLGYLRDLQRGFHSAVLLVHHARKAAAGARAGQALRGSSELHAWGDSNLYLRRRGEALRLSIEHRAAPCTEGLAVELRGDEPTLALRLADSGGDRSDPPPPPSTILDRVAQTLAAASAPLTRHELRRACRVRMSTLGEALATLTAQGRVLRSGHEYQAADGDPRGGVPVPRSL
jgi:hypothetical protein